MKLDILALAAHPDDVELSCSGTLVKYVKEGKKVGIVDFTEGQLGSRGSVELRYEEAAKASEIMGLHARENLQMEDGWFQNDPEHQLKVIRAIRKYRPEIVFCNAVSDRHPDHGKGSKLASEACFYSGLRKIETELDGVVQEAWRPKVVYHYIQDRYMKPDFIVDVTEHWETKLASIKAYGSQFFDPNSKEPATPISGKDFLDFIEARGAQFGRLINARFGEGFVAERPIGVDDLFSLR